MRDKEFQHFDRAIEASIDELVHLGDPVDTGHWQGVSTEGKPDLTTVELMNHFFMVPTFRASWYDTLDSWIDDMAMEIKPNAEWADEHFEERVGGVPRNPDPSHKRWPWWVGQDEQTKQDGKFTHTYSERFWPTQDGDPSARPPRGIRYEFGDYHTLLTLLLEKPFTRQAYLPIFFPEDTGAVHHGRVPCTLGYQFLLRDKRLHMWYTIRSCDAVRHFRDDVYLAVRLLGHTLNWLFERELRSDGEQVWVDVEPGNFYFTAYSFHVHRGDLHHVKT